MSLHALRQLDPFTHLDRDALATVARHCRRVRLAAGRGVATGDGGASTFAYLLKGALQLEGAGPTRRLRANRAESSSPLPDRTTGIVATTLEPCEILYVDVTQVAFLLGRPSLDGFEVRTLDDAIASADWSERFLRRGFASGPPRLLHRTFAALEPFEVDRQVRVLEEGEAGDAYFIVASGRVEIRRRDGFCAQLEPGDAFGEEALLGRGYRCASATMLEAGRLMRLPAAVFRDALLPAAMKFLPAPACDPGGLVVDLDLPFWRARDARVWLASVRAAALRSRSLTVLGGQDLERLRFAFLAARAGFEVAVSPR